MSIITESKQDAGFPRIPEFDHMHIFFKSEIIYEYFLFG
jgi:hypothetical protein